MIYVIYDTRSRKTVAAELTVLRGFELLKTLIHDDEGFVSIIFRCLSSVSVFPRAISKQYISVLNIYCTTKRIFFSFFLIITVVDHRRRRIDTRVK